MNVVVTEDVGSLSRMIFTELLVKISQRSQNSRVISSINVSTAGLCYTFLQKCYRLLGNSWKEQPFQLALFQVATNLRAESETEISYIQRKSDQDVFVMNIFIV